MHKQEHCDYWDCEECKSCNNCDKVPTVVWIDVGKFCDDCFEEVYIERNGDYRVNK